MSLTISRRAIIRAAGAGVALKSVGMAAAQPADSQYPVRPIKVIVPFAPGGAVDVFARVFVKDLGEKLGQNVIIDNKPGAGGNIGMGMTAKAAPDGYTLCLVSSTFVINPFLYASVPYDPKTSFAPVINLVGAPTLLIANAKSEQRSVKQLVQAMKAKPGAFNYASPGIGTSQHLAGELFRLATGTTWSHIPYNGAGPSVAAVVANDVEFGFSSLPAAAPFIKTGQLRALAVTTSARYPGMANVPTFVEEGFPKVVVEYFQALLAPAGTPPQIVAKIAEASNEVMKKPDISKRLMDMGFTIIGGSPKDFAEQIDKELVKWPAVVQASGAKVE